MDTISRGVTSRPRTAAARAHGLDGPTERAIADGMTPEDTFMANSSVETPLPWPRPVCRALQAAAAPPSDPLFDHFMRGEAGATPDHLAYLDRGIENSPYRSEVEKYVSRLEAAPAPSAGADASPLFPRRGEVPSIDTSALAFLHPDVKTATVCVGRYDDHGQFHARWFGRNPLENVEMWSSTKLIPLFATVARANGVAPAVRVGDCVVHDPSGQRKDKPFADVVRDVVTYGSGVPASNAEARMLKHFFTPSELESWLKGLTGNSTLEFRGGYGAAPYIERPLLIDRKSGKVVLSSPGAAHGGVNSVSSYDLCRIISTIGAHAHLPADARVPGVQKASLCTLIQGLGGDPARYTDVAWDALGIAPHVAEPVILSKLGFGESSARRTVEGVYTAFVRFLDTREGLPGRPVIVGLSLKVARPANEAGAYLKVDARTAASVAQILGRVADGQLA